MFRKFSIRFNELKMRKNEQQGRIRLMIKICLNKNKQIVNKKFYFVLFKSAIKFII